MDQTRERATEIATVPAPVMTAPVVGELSDEDLEVVVGGLTRAWLEAVNATARRTD